MVRNQLETLCWPAKTLVDLVQLTGRTQPLPSDVDAALGAHRQLDLRLIAGHLLPDPGLAALATQLLAEVDDRRRLILTSPTFAPKPCRTYDSPGADLLQDKTGRFEPGLPAARAASVRMPGAVNDRGEGSSTRSALWDI